MAKTVRTTTVETADAPSDDVEVVLTESEEIESDAIRELLAVGGENEVRWKVERISPVEKAGYCATYISGDLSLDRIREEWGGGKFKITGWDSLGKYVGRRTIAINEATKIAAPQGPQLGELAALMNAGKGDMQAILLTMIKSQGDMVAALLSKPAAPVAPPVDPMQIQATMLAMMVSMKEMFKPEKSNTDSVDVLLKGLELGKEIMGGSQGGADWTDVLMRGMDTVKPILSEAMKNATPTQTVRPRVEAQILPPTGASPPVRIASQTQAPVIVESKTEPRSIPATPNDGENSMLQVIPWLTRQTQALVLQASRNKSAELYAEVFLDNLPDFLTPEMVLENFSKPDAIDTLGTLNADVLKYRAWFEEFRESVIDFLEDSQEGAESEPELNMVSGTDRQIPVDTEQVADSASSSDDSHLD